MPPTGPRAFNDDEHDGLPLDHASRFMDADLLGFPLRIVVGTRGLKEGMVELRDRRTKATVTIAPAALTATVSQARDRLLAELVAADGR